MRYFLVTFSLSDKFSLGTICFEHEDFFSYAELFDMIKKQHPYAPGIVIVNIYEFADRQDFVKFKGETKATVLDEYVEEGKNILRRTYSMTDAMLGFINQSTMLDYFKKNVPITEAVADLMQRRLS